VTTAVAFSAQVVSNPAAAIQQWKENNLHVTSSLLPVDGPSSAGAKSNSGFNRDHRDDRDPTLHSGPNERRREHFMHRERELLREHFERGRGRGNSPPKGTGARRERPRLDRSRADANRDRSRSRDRSPSGGRSRSFSPPRARARSFSPPTHAEEDDRHWVAPDIQRQPRKPRRQGQGPQPSDSRQGLPPQAWDSYIPSEDNRLSGPRRDRDRDRERDRPPKQSSTLIRLLPLNTSIPLPPACVYIFHMALAASGICIMP
jgi:hypothetical protein